MAAAGLPGSPQLITLPLPATPCTGGAMRNESCNLGNRVSEYNAASGSGGAMANYGSSVSVADAEFATLPLALLGQRGRGVRFGGSVFAAQRQLW